MRGNDLTKGIIIMATMISVLALSIAYASLSQELYITGVTDVRGKTWDISFQKLDAPILKGTAKETDLAELSSTTMHYHVSLTNPGDSVTYSWEVTNNGELDSKLSSDPVLNGINEATTNFVTYYFTYGDGTVIKENDKLKSGESKKLRLIIKLLDDADLKNDDTSFDLTTTLTYIQDK